MQSEFASIYHLSENNDIKHFLNSFSVFSVNKAIIIKNTILTLSKLSYADQF